MNKNIQIVLNDMDFNVDNDNRKITTLVSRSKSRI